MKKPLISARELIWHEQPVSDEILAEITRINKDLVVYPKTKRSKSSGSLLPEIGKRYVVFAKRSDQRVLFDEELVFIIWFPKPLDSNSWICLADENPVWEIEGEETVADKQVLERLAIIVCSVERDKKMEDKYLFSIMVEKILDLNNLVDKSLEKEKNTLCEFPRENDRPYNQKIETHNLIVTFSGEMGFFEFNFYRKMKDSLRLIISGDIQESKEFYYLENFHCNKLNL